MQERAPGGDRRRAGAWEGRQLRTTRLVIVVLLAGVLACLLGSAAARAIHRMHAYQPRVTAARHVAAPAGLAHSSLSARHDATGKQAGQPIRPRLVYAVVVLSVIRHVLPRVPRTFRPSESSWWLLGWPPMTPP